MKEERRSVDLFLVDGTSHGLMEANFKGSSTKITVVPAAQIHTLGDRVDGTAVYILLGADPESPLRQVVYIGQSDNILKRLLQHQKDEQKAFWETTAIITGGESFTGGHAEYLEARFIKIANDELRWVRVANDKFEALPKLSEPQEAFAKRLEEEILELLPIVGFPFDNVLRYTQKMQSAENSLSNSPDFYLNFSGITAIGRQIEEKFFVLKGSYARKETVPSLNKLYSQLREQLLEDGSLQSGEKFLTFTKDVDFKSPSVAASVICGSNVSGRGEWITEQGNVTYGKWYDAKVVMKAAKVLDEE